MSLGSYPSVSIVKVRILTHHARGSASSGRDPIDSRSVDKYYEVHTFEELCEELLAREVNNGNSKLTLIKNRRYLFDHCAKLLPLDITTITPADVLAVLKRIESQGSAYTAMRVRSKVSEVSGMQRLLSGPLMTPHML